MKEDLKALRLQFLPPIKSIIIFGLVALALFQVSQLWFVNFTNRNFFLYIQARFAQTPPNEQGAFVRPFRITYGAGDGLFNVQLSRIEDSDFWNYGKRTIEAILRHGEFITKTELDAEQTERIISQPVMIYEYAFNMNAELFAQIFNQRTGAFLTGNDLNCFRAIVIQPATPNENESIVRVFFIDNYYSWEFHLPIGTRRNPVEDFEFYIPSVFANNRHFLHAHSLIFSVNTAQGFSYQRIHVTNPYLDHHGMLSHRSIRPQIESFFGNPATINQAPIIGGGTFTFSNLNTRVRYLEKHVLEYQNFPITRVASSSFIADFSAAFDFVYNDPNVINEFFLYDYEMRGRGYVFLFNYVIGEFPLLLEEYWATVEGCENPLRAPIEVVVDDGRVIGYRRIVYNFQLTNEHRWISLYEFENLESITLGFPIGIGPRLDLQMFGGIYQH